jgi:hypothetical protein
MPSLELLLATAALVYFQLRQIISANHDEQDRLIIGASTCATAINTLAETA